MTSLGADDFPAFFKETYGVPPFPWQTCLAKSVAETGSWPSLLDLPTGAGKTAAIDIAVFHLAMEAEKRAARSAPLRMLFVVDRRLVVDNTFDRASLLARKLCGAKNGVLRAVADRLRLLGGKDAPPLDVVRLRGGVPRERDWARSPAQPLVAVSTIDQVGSRLLFRGYGVSPKMWPVHAGLVGSDALWLLDEVHLSQPFEQTLAAIEQGHRTRGGGSLADYPRLAPFAVVRLSATPGKAGEVFRLTEADRKNDVLSPRLTAHKRATLESWEGEGDGAEYFATHALILADWGPAQAPRKKPGKAVPDANGQPPKRLAVVVNRVDLARRVFEKIQREAGQRARVLLVTGRIRPLDREKILAEMGPLFAARERPDPVVPIILVATQTIEAGADLDVEALVTEIAPLDSLRQRFGRLDRLGAKGETRAVILHPREKPSKKQDKEDRWTPITRIYGDSAYATKEWLAGLDNEFDFGIDALEPVLKKTSTEELASLLAPRAHAPVLLPPYVELWATTSPAPAATPEPSLFLHGPGVSADVQIVWRADVDPTDEEGANRSLSICPPSSLEAMPVPIWAVSTWLDARGGEAGIADVPAREPDSYSRGKDGRYCLRRNGERWVRAVAGDLQPGDTIVVPCAYGGCDCYGWNPESRNPVTDFGAEAHCRQRHKGAVRITRETLRNALKHTGDGGDEAKPEEVWRRIAALLIGAEDNIDAAVLRDDLVDIDGLPQVWGLLLTAMPNRAIKIEFYDQNDRAKGFMLFVERSLPRSVLDGETEESEHGKDAVTDREDSSDTGVEVALIAHLGDVEQKARDFARRAGLPERMIKLLGLAGRLHDLGKAEPRFQADLRGASALARLGLIDVAGLDLLAKSAREEYRSRAVRAAPKNFRHEALSVALAKKHPVAATLAEEERDLVLWLVGTHHGYGRPFFPPSQDEAPQTGARLEIDAAQLTAQANEAPLRLDQGWFELAERLNRRYGPWELARLEAILRLADHAASAEEQERENVRGGSPVAREARP